MADQEMLVGSVTLHARPTPAPCFYFQGVDDWYTLPDSKATSDPIPNQHGDFDGGPDWSGPAVVTVHGFAKGTTRAELIGLQQQLNSMRSLDALTPMTLIDDAGPTTRQVSIRRIKWDDMRNQRSVGFVLYAEANDPLRYGPDNVVSTGLPVSGGGYRWAALWPSRWGSGGIPGRAVQLNVGSEPTSNILLAMSGGLTAGFSAISIEDGREVRLERVIPLGQIAYVDFMTGRAYLDTPDNDITAFLTRSDFWQVPAGGQRTVQLNSLGGSSGTPTLTVTTSPPYL